MFKNYKSYKEKANRQAYKSKTEFNFNVMKETLEKYLDTIRVEPSELALTLPNLQLT